MTNVQLYNEHHRIRKQGYRIQSDQRIESVLVEVRLLRKPRDVGLVIFEVIFSEPVHSFSGRIPESVQAL